MAVSVRMIVPPLAGAVAHVMLGAQRAVRHERERRHDRQTGREASAQQMDESNHPRTELRYVSEILFADLMPVQSRQRYNSTRNCADLVAFGKITGSECLKRQPTCATATDTLPALNIPKYGLNQALAALGRESQAA